MTKLQQFDDDQEAIDRLLAGLSMRERQVLTHVITGRLNKQIASDLGITEQTVKVHRSRMMTKLGMRCLVDLVRFAVYARLLPEYRLPGRDPVDQRPIGRGAIALQA